MCFSLVLTGSMSLWHFKVQVINVHWGDVNLSVFQSQDIFQLLLPQRSLPSQCLWCPSWIQEALQCQQGFTKPSCYPILFSSTSLSSSKKSQSLFKRWGFYWAFSYLNWEKPIIFRVFFTRLNRKMTFFYFEFRAWVTLSGELKSTVITFRRNIKLVDGEEADMRIARKQAKTGPLNGWKGLREARGPRWCWKWVCGVGIVRTSYPPPSFQKDSAEPLLSELRFGGGLKRDWVCSFHQIVPNFLVG